EGRGLAFGGSHPTTLDGGRLGEPRPGGRHDAGPPPKRGRSGLGGPRAPHAPSRRRGRGPGRGTAAGPPPGAVDGGPGAPERRHRPRLRPRPGGGTPPTRTRGGRGRPDGRVNPRRLLAFAPAPEGPYPV
ncbi:MAG: hypothetical protein AVDCRST_MAG05-2769, partial [uncultured Rubrobacteraceae bacterium]